MAVAVAVLNACCNSGNLNVTPLRSAGKQIQSPNYNAGNCLPDGSVETLESIRYVEPGYLYYMDYTADVDMDRMIYPAGTIDIYSTGRIYDDRDALLYVNPSKTVAPESLGGACSGFVSFNPAGELLFGRNYDNHLDPLVVVFNKNVKPGEHKSVMMTDLQLAQSLGWKDLQYSEPYCMLNDGRDLSILLRQPFFCVDGMNDAGLCIAAYQLPAFVDPQNPVEEAGPNKSPRPTPVKQNTGKQQIQFFGMHNLILNRCATVKDVIDFFKSYDYASNFFDFNLHWFVADAAATYAEDSWQNFYAPKARVTSMMMHYSPVMTEEEALRCLQFGNFAIDVPGVPTAWSCVYNAKQRTVLFNMHDDLSNVWSIDLKKDLN